MKHLKTFNESKENDTIKQYCEDILLELNDTGFTTEVQIYPNPDWSTHRFKYSRLCEIKIDIINQIDFKTDDQNISDILYSLDGYLKTQGFNRRTDILYGKGRGKPNLNYYEIIYNNF
jgi:hypothetical protein